LRLTLTALVRRAQSPLEIIHCYGQQLKRCPVVATQLQQYFQTQAVAMDKRILIQ
jgi:hypothetical protein